MWSSRTWQHSVNILGWFYEELQDLLELTTKKVLLIIGFPDGSDGKESTCNAGDLSSILGSEDPLEEGMATHSSILAWRIPMDIGAYWAI